MQIAVQLFGPVADMVGRRLIELTIEGPLNAARLVDEYLARSEPALIPILPHCRLAINHAYAKGQERITATDELALIGMVNGG